MEVTVFVDSTGTVGGTGGLGRAGWDRLGRAGCWGLRRRS